MEEVVELVTLGKDEKEEEEGKEEVWKGEEEKEQLPVRVGACH